MWTCMVYTVNWLANEIYHIAGKVEQSLYFGDFGKFE